MAITEYDKVYAASRVADIDAQVETLDAERARLLDERARYAPKPKRTRKPATD